MSEDEMCENGHQLIEYQSNAIYPDCPLCLCQDELIETKFALDVERNDNDRLRAALNKRKLKGAQT